MTSKVEWLMEGHVLLYQHSGVIDLEGSKDANQAAFQMASQYPDNVIHTIFDFSEAQSINLTLDGIKASAQDTEKIKNIGWMAVVNSPKGTLRVMINMLTTIFGQLLRIKVRQFDSLEAAVEYLQEIDPTISNLEAPKKQE